MYVGMRVSLAGKHSKIATQAPNLGRFGPAASMRFLPELIADSQGKKLQSSHILEYVNQFIVCLTVLEVLINQI